MWQFNAATPMPQGLKLVHDRPSQYTIAPTANMPLDKYKAVQAVGQPEPDTALPNPAALREYPLLMEERAQLRIHARRSWRLILRGVPHVKCCRRGGS